ncbi:hypothetical protein SAY86_011568 [Trapa natans]|uniref:Uncharacterized protein n=1 Tax=Trapa natans TaxID=22666 RepID=A0AAN7LVD2_TRANT|nr:hypothetical protein SAY86_011568 [Trapa natans]
MGAASSLSLHRWSRAIHLESPSPSGNPYLVHRFSTTRVGGVVLKEDIVVIGDGIAGLATFLSLHRVGMK